MSNSDHPKKDVDTPVEDQEGSETTDNIVNIRQAAEEITSNKIASAEDALNDAIGQLSDNKYIAHLENKDADLDRRIHAARMVRYYRSAENRERILHLFRQIIEDETEDSTLVRHVLSTWDHLEQQEQKKGSNEAPGKGLRLREIVERIDKDELNEKIACLEDKEGHHSMRYMAMMELLNHKMSKLPKRLESLLFRIFNDEDEDLRLRGYAGAILACFPGAKGGEEVLEILMSGDEESQLADEIRLGFQWQARVLGGPRIPKSKEITEHFADRSQPKEKRLMMGRYLSCLSITPEEAQRVWAVMNDSNESRAIRSKAAKVLAEQNDQQISDQLEQTLNESEDAELREDIADALVTRIYLDADGNESILVDLLNNTEKSREIRTEACQLLEWFYKDRPGVLEAITRFKWQKG